MRLQTCQRDGATVIAVSGTITVLDQAGQLRAEVASQVAAGQRHFVLSLAHLTQIDSSCIGELVSCCLTVARAGGSLKLANPARRVEELLLVTRLGQIFECYESESAAIESFGRLNEGRR